MTREGHHFEEFTSFKEALHTETKTRKKVCVIVPSSSIRRYAENAVTSTYLLISRLFRRVVSISRGACFLIHDVMTQRKESRGAVVDADLRALG